MIEDLADTLAGAQAAGHRPTPAGAQGPCGAVSDDPALRERHRRWCNVRRVLLVLVADPGEVLTSSPAFAAIRETLPWSHLTLLTTQASLALRPHLDMIDECIGFNAAWTPDGAAALAEEPPGMRGEAERHLVRRLGRNHFDAAILFTPSGRSALPMALMCRMAGIAQVLAAVHEPAHGLVSDEVAEPMALVSEQGLRAEVLRSLALVGHVGLRTQDERLRFRLQPRDQRAMRQALLQAGWRDGQRYVLVWLGGAPGASDAHRQTPSPAPAVRTRNDAEAHVATDAPSASRPWADTVLVLAGSQDPARIDAARAALQRPGLVLPQVPTLGELVALLAGSGAVVGSDPALAPFAAAVGTLVVDLRTLAPVASPVRQTAVGRPTADVDAAR